MPEGEGDYGRRAAETRPEVLEAKAYFSHSGTVRTAAYDVDVPFMQLARVSY